MKIYTIDKLYEQHMTINRGIIQQTLQVVIFYLKQNSAFARPWLST